MQTAFPGGLLALEHWPAEAQLAWAPKKESTPREENVKVKDLRKVVSAPGP